MKSNSQYSTRRRARKGSKSAVKLADVARVAGVSTASVSRALNEPHMVSDKLREAVLNAVQDLEWMPHGAARALASLRTRTIGAIIPTLANANFATEINALQKRLIEAGYILLIGCSEYDPDQALAQAREMIQRGVDGLILVGENYSDQMWRLLAKQQLPYVITYSFRAESKHPSVGVDNYRAFVRLTNCVLDHGHRRIGIIAQKIVNNDRAEARLRGALDALQARGIQLEKEHLVEKEWSIAEGRAGLREIMAVRPCPTAVVCINDFLAVGAVLESGVIGLRVPTDLSVVGFDDLEIASHLSPALTTMRVPTEQMGRLTADCLLTRLEGKSAAQSIELEVELVMRQTLARLPQG